MTGFHLLLMICLLVSVLALVATAQAFEDDMGIRVYNAGDGKTLCEMKLNEYVKTGQFSCNFSGKDANIIRDGSDQIAMEVFSFRTKQAYNKRVEKVQHIDESLHLGHYHKFYIDDEKREYVQKVLLTSGLACVIKEAFHSILDGWIWDYVGMPLMNFVKTALTWRRRKVSLQ